MTRTRFDDLRAAIDVLECHAAQIDEWGRDLAIAFQRGHRLLVAGNGGSAALAAHLTAELVGRYRDERRPLSAIWLGADQAAFSALLNDYGPDEVFARQVEAHGTAGDVLLTLSTSGRSPNLLAAARRASARGVEVWALTGHPGSPLARAADRSMSIEGTTALAQELHQVIVHMMCESLDAHLAECDQSVMTERI